eukprot:1162154-Pelagomonas_calceolata.AAC.10
MTHTQNGKPYPPCLVFLTGGAGTKKSHFLRCVCDEIRILRSKLPHACADKEKVLVTAFTGKAAANVQGSTMHTAFYIRPEEKSSELDGMSLKMQTQMADELYKLGVVCVEEVGIVLQKLFVCASSRMNAVMRVPNIQFVGDRSEPVHSVFGDLDVILIGDYYQIQAVPDNSSIIDFVKGAI